MFSVDFRATFKIEIKICNFKVSRHYFENHSSCKDPAAYFLHPHSIQDFLKPSSLNCLKLFECEAKENRQHLQTSIPMDGNVMHYENLN